MAHFYRQLLFFFAITLVVYLFFVDFAFLRFNTADASTYLNIGENIATHKGFVVSFDLYQYFTNRYHPLWPFMHPLYPLLCSLVFILHGGIEQVIKLNIVILGINAALIFYLIQTLIPSRLNLLFLVYVVFSFNFFYSALFPWTEQLHFLFFLITFILYLKFPKDPRALLGVGALNGILFLIRVSHVYSVLAYLFIILINEGKIRDRLKDAAVFVSGFLLVMGPYQLFNWVTYHSLYPQYLKPAAQYTLARYSRLSTYQAGEMGMYNPSGFRFAIGHTTYFYEHMIDLCRGFLFFLIPVMAYLSIPHDKKEGRFFVLNCLCQSAFIVLAYSYSFCWDPDLESLRYSLIPFVLVVLAGWFCIYELFFARGNARRKAFVVILLVGMSLFSVIQYWGIRRQCIDDPRTKRPFYVDLYQAFDWINQNLPKDVLIASDEDQEGYFMHRPFISMPPGKSFSCANLMLYNQIHSPDYYLISMAIPDECFASIPHTMVFSDKIFRIFKVTKGK